MNTENHLKPVLAKEPYTAPAIEIIPMETCDPVMQGSFPSSSTRSRSRNASASELEDLINDILTIEK